MLHILEGVRPGENELLDQAFNLRHRVFIDELHWKDLRSNEGREIDQFDTVYTTYLLAVRNGKVAGNMRMIPTAKPHLLSTVRKAMCQTKYETGYHVWEWSRFSIDPSFRGKSEVGDISSEILLGAVEWGLDNGVKEVIVEYETYHITRFRDFGFVVKPLGTPTDFDGKSYTAVHMRYDDTAVTTMRAFRGVQRPIEKEVVFGSLINGTLVPSLER